MNAMKMLVLPILCLVMTGICAADTVTLSSLLKEMTDSDANTYLPELRYTARLWSSYDRRTKTPDDQSGWFSNLDYSNFIREENTEGRREYVMLDTKGPGAITRFWVTVAHTDGKGILRLYIDGKCVVTGEVLKIIGGDALCGVPLSDSVSREVPFFNRGHNLYLPILYAESCKVTYESKFVHTAKKGRDGKMRKENFYYNIETRTYSPGTAVESFSLDVLKRNRAVIADTNWKLANRLNGIEKGVGEQIAFDGTIQTDIPAVQRPVRVDEPRESIKPLKLPSTPTASVSTLTNIDRFSPATAVSVTGILRNRSVWECAMVRL